MKRAVIASILPLAAPAVAAAQPATPPATIEACYVPASGTIYRINAPGAPSACHSPAHVRFAWNQQGVPGPAGTIGPDLTLGGALSVGRTGAFGGEIGRAHV